MKPSLKVITISLGILTLVVALTSLALLDQEEPSALEPLAPTGPRPKSKAPPGVASVPDVELPLKETSLDGASQEDEGAPRGEGAAAQSKPSQPDGATGENAENSIVLGEWDDGYEVAYKLTIKPSFMALLDGELLNPTRISLTQDEKLQTWQFFSNSVGRLKAGLSARRTAVNALLDRKWEDGDGTVLRHEQSASGEGQTSEDDAALLHQEVQPDQWKITRSVGDRTMLFIIEWGEDPAVDAARFRLKVETENALNLIQDYLQHLK